MPPPQGNPIPTLPPMAAPASSGRATASLVLGICGLTFCPIICSILAIIFGALAKREINERPGMGGWGQAQAGLILGIVGIALWVIGILLLVVLGVLVENATDDYDYYYQALMWA